MTIGGFMIVFGESLVVVLRRIVEAVHKAVAVVVDGGDGGRWCGVSASETGIRFDARVVHR